MIVEILWSSFSVGWDSIELVTIFILNFWHSTVQREELSPESLWTCLKLNKSFTSVIMLIGDTGTDPNLSTKCSDLLGSADQIIEF